MAAFAALLTGGLPLGAGGIAGMAILGYAALALPRVPGRWAALLAGGFAVVIGLKLAACVMAPPVGLLASYWPAAAPGDAPPERSTDFRWLAGATRIEPRLALRGEEFQAHFFNDAARFNIGPEQQPGRDQLPFFVRWEGWLLVSSDGPRRFEVDAAGASRLWIDGAEVPGEVSLRAGLHPIKVEYARPEARVPRLEVRWQPVVDGLLEPIGGADVRWQPKAGSGELGRVLGVLGDAGFVLLAALWVCLGLAALLKARVVDRVARAVLGTVPLLFLLHGMLLHAPMLGRATILSGLDDWLIYESSARDILLNGWLMDGGQGHAPPFYGQPLYPYVLALAHRLTGEGLFGPLALQFLALGLLVVCTAVLARRAFGGWIDGLVAATCLLVLVELEAEHFKIARQLFTENVYMPLVMASLITLVGLARRPTGPTWWQAVLAGGLLGLTAIARSQFLLFVPIGLFVLVLAWRRRAPAPVALMVAGMLLCIAPVTARNLAVSGQFVVISSSGGASLLEFHRPPPGVVDQGAIARDPLYEALHLDASTRTVLAFVRADPGGYLATLLPLGAHSVGLRGRNDPGIYWPLLLTCLAYVLAFGVRCTRKLHVWPIHAFVFSHLIVLMFFEADTYGYRLVMPMYAPMVAVAAQLPLAALRWVFAPRRTARRGQPVYGEPFAVAGWGLVAACALIWQAKTLVDIWPQREAALHGLGGVAVQAVATADKSNAGAIYVASIDGTPRRFGAGMLAGLRWPWIKWFDPGRALPVPGERTTAVYLLSELSGHELDGDLTRCLGSSDVTTATGADVMRQCATGGVQVDITFDGLARIRQVAVPNMAEAGTVLEARLLWQPLVAHPAPQQISLQLDDPQSGGGILWGNGTLEPYPASEWQTDEAVLTRIPVTTDGTALPQAYRVTLGIGPTQPGAPQATATWQGTRQQRIPVASVALTPGTEARLPSDMRAVDGPTAAGIELVATRPLPEEAAIGGPLRIGMVWRAAQDQPPATQFSVRLVRGNGDVVQETTLPLLGGRVSPSMLRAGNIVRDEQSVIVSPRVPTESLAVEVGFHGAMFALGQVKTTGRAHTLADANAPTLADFGGAIAVQAASVAHDKAQVTVKLRWRAEREIAQAYKVFVHVLDPAGTQVVAQKDAEPQDGRAPTTAWVQSEVIEDEYALTLPSGLQTGDYPVEIGLYDAQNGQRLKLPSGDSRLLLDTRLHVAP